MRQDSFRALAESAHQLQDRFAADFGRCVTVGPMPILYFGNSAAYERSMVGIVTVAINPSGDEFPAGNRDLRFPVGELEAAKGSPAYWDVYRRSLDGYFDREPHPFFCHWQDVLKGFPAGRGRRLDNGGGQAPCALHLDVCTPIATRPAWGQLGRECPRARTRLINVGIPFWWRLVQWLEPDVILLSVAREVFNRSSMRRRDGRDCRLALASDGPGVEAYFRLSLPAGTDALLVYAPNGSGNGVPFGLTTSVERNDLGRRASAAWGRVSSIPDWRRPSWRTGSP